jgi:hypothetical protein
LQGRQNARRKRGLDVATINNEKLEEFEAQSKKEVDRIGAEYNSHVSHTLV